MTFNYGLTDYGNTASSAMGADDSLMVLMSTDNGATWTTVQLWTAANAPNNTSNYFLYNIASNSPTVKFAFYGSDGVVSNAPDYEFHVDNFVIETAPACSAPLNAVSSNISVTGATVSWTAPSPAPANGYEYYVSTTNTEPVAGTTPTGTVAAGTTTVNITGLTGATNYFVWVRAVCGAGNVSAWITAPVTFTTQCAPVPLPISEGFNATTIPTCWTTQIAAVQTATKISFVANATNPTITPYEGTHFVSYSSFSSSGGTSGSEERLISRPLNSTGVPTVIVDFAWLLDNTAYTSSSYASEGVQVQYSIDNGTTWTDAGAFIGRFDGSNSTAQWVNKSVTLPAAAGNVPNLLVAFKFHSAYGNNMGLDAVSIHAPLACTNPGAVTLTGSTGSGATFSWTAATPAPSGGYQYYISTTSGAPSASTTPTGTVATGTSVTVSNLTPNTTYYFWVRSNCGSSQSGWVGGTQLVTPCGPCLLYTSPSPRD